MGIELLIGAAIVSTAASAVYQNEAADATRDAARAQKKQEDLRVSRERINSIRQARIAAGRVAMAGENQGASNLDSGREGGVSSILSQLGSNMGFSLQMEALSDQAATEMGKAAKYGSYASIFGSAANLALTAASYSKPSVSGTTTPTQTVSSIFGPMSEDTLQRYN
jgi:type II secretory pathway pseudopilin PulG